MWLILTLITSANFLGDTVFERDGVVAKGCLLLFQRGHNIVPSPVVVKVTATTSLNYITELALLVLAKVTHLRIELIIEGALVGGLKVVHILSAIASVL